VSSELHFRCRPVAEAYPQSLYAQATYVATSLISKSAEELDSVRNLAADRTTRVNF
jgi:hypothetical protein